LPDWLSLWFIWKNSRVLWMVLEKQTGECGASFLSLSSSLFGRKWRARVEQNDWLNENLRDFMNNFDMTFTSDVNSHS
jgi:hypothetical protein